MLRVEKIEERLKEISKAVVITPLDTVHGPLYVEQLLRHQVNLEKELMKAKERERVKVNADG